MLWGVWASSCYIPDDTIDVNRAGLCAEVCTQQRVNGCPGGEGYVGVDGPVTCETACEDQFNADPTLEELLLCEAKAETCDSCEGTVK
jgi:hypothetical protein